MLEALTSFKLFLFGCSALRKERARMLREVRFGGANVRMLVNRASP